jgi:hypothetical protein
MKVDRLETMSCDAGWRSFSFLKVTTDSGIVGWSEYNESFGSTGLSQVIDALAPLVIGMDPMRIELASCTLHAVRMRPSPARISVPGPITMVTPGWVSGLPALPMAAIRPSFSPTSALRMPVWSRMSALVMTVSMAPPARVTCDWPIPSRITLPPPNFTSSP